MIRIRLLCAWVMLVASCTCGGTEECIVDGTSHRAGSSFPAGDGCNQCVCGSDGEAVCTQSTCLRGEDAGAPLDAGVDGGGQDAGVVTNTQVPVPELSCDVVAVNGAPPGAQLLPMDEVTVSAGSYPTPTAGANLTAVAWSLARVPAGARPALEPRDQVQAELRQALVAGVYVLRAALADDAGGTASHDCKLLLVPSSSLWVELFWDKASADLDLHAIKRDGQGRYCDPVVTPTPGGLVENCDSGLACYFATCQVDSIDHPTWDSSDGGPAGGNPVLVKDVNSFGPELLQVASALDGEYLIGVDFYTDRGDGQPALATVRVWMHGLLRAQATRSLDRDGWWEAFVLRWSNAGDVCLDDPAGSTAPVCHPPVQCAPPTTCIQCTDSSACGPGTHCETMRCLPDVDVCASDATCVNGQRCLQAADFCSDPACLDRGDCPDSRYQCTAELYQCELPAAQCSESDEPNDDPAQATNMPSDTYSATLCRGDVDVVRLEGHADTLLYVDIAFGDSNASGVVTELRRADGSVADQHLLSYAETFTLTADVRSSEPLFLVLRGDGTADERWSYSVTVRELVQLPICLDEPGEPNDELAQATGSVLAPGHHERAFCGLWDTDYHAIELPPAALIELTATCEHLSDWVHFELYEADGAHLFSSAGTTLGASVSLANFGSTARPLVMQMERLCDVSCPVQHAYAVDVALQPLQRLPSCDPDRGEPNDDVNQAANAPLTPGTDQRGLCGRFDQDHYALVAPAGTRLSISVTFSHGLGDLRLELLDSNGALVGINREGEDLRWSEFTNHGALEVALAAHVWRTSPWSWPEQQPYTVALQVVAVDACDDGYEPNDSLQQASVVTIEWFDAFACNASDRDYYRIQDAAANFVDLTLSPEAGPGDLDLYLWTATGQLLASSEVSDRLGYEYISYTGMPIIDTVIEVRPRADVLGPKPYSLLVAAGTVVDAGFPDAQHSHDANVLDAIVDVRVPDAGP